MNPTQRLINFGLILLFSVSLLACASSEIGDACDTSGAADECVEGAICTQINSGDNVCRKTCTADTDCGSEEACNGVSGSSTKSCQPKTKK
ncbi:MAG: hypothetical protein KC502_20650 [Myxococcales bacterium]|nr:hypothetical protein [Myxococcales bacterium]